MPEISPALYRAGAGEPLLLLHGFTGTWHHWRPVLPELVARFEVIAPTLAGHDGGPPFPMDRPLTLAGAGDVLERQLDELGVGSAHIAGNSLGGGLALELAKRGRARSVVALAPGGGWRPESGESQRLARFFARQQQLMRATQARLPTVMRRPGPRRLALRDAMLHGELCAPDEAVALIRRALRCRITGLVIKALREGGVELSGLDRVAAPTLVAWPRADRILPMALHAERFREEVGGVEFRVLEGVGHVPMWDAPQPTAELIAGFVQRHAGDAAPVRSEAAA
jgi:pimeloyl-ACP methyl ester carboxylesterase